MIAGRCIFTSFSRHFMAAWQRIPQFIAVHSKPILRVGSAVFHLSVHGIILTLACFKTRFFRSTIETDFRLPYSSGKLD